jgi:hypothetical protein
MKRLALLAASLVVAAAAGAQQQSWKDANGNPIPDTESRGSRDGLAGSLTIVTDADWREKWNTPSSTVPSFHEARDVAKGERVFVLIFFANPLPSAQGIVDMRCDIDIVRPDGQSALHQSGVGCWHRPVAGALTNIQLSDPVIQFSGDPPDPVGDWIVRVALKDTVRGTVLPLTASFHLH